MSKPRKTDFEKLINYKPLKNKNINEITDYIHFAIDYSKLKNYNLYNLSYFIADQLSSYTEIDNFKEGLITYLELKGSLNLKKQQARHGKIQGEKLYNEMLQKNRIFTNGKWTEQELTEHRKKVSEKFKENNKLRSKEEKRAQSWGCIEFWLKKGFSKEEAQIKINEKSEYLRETTKWSNGSSTVSPENSNVCIEYWIKRYGEIEGPIRYRKRQITFNLEICIEKYGIEDGIKRWKERQEKWLKTLNEKPEEEKLEILKRKLTPFGKASKSSLKLFLPLINDILNENLVSYDEIFIGFDDKKEYFLIQDKQIKFFDFCIPSIKIIIEFHGLLFHYDELIDDIPNNIFNLDVNLIKTNDILKEKFAINNGFDYITIWENEDLNDARRKCLDRIRDNCRKYKNTAE